MGTNFIPDGFANFCFKKSFIPKLPFCLLYKCVWKWLFAKYCHYFKNTFFDIEFKSTKTNFLLFQKWEKKSFLHQKKGQNTKNAIFGLKKKTGFLDWNYTFFHVSGHCAILLIPQNINSPFKNQLKKWRCPNTMAILLIVLEEFPIQNSFWRPLCWHLACQNPNSVLKKSEKKI